MKIGAESFAVLAIVLLVVWALAHKPKSAAATDTAGAVKDPALGQLGQLGHPPEDLMPTTNYAIYLPSQCLVCR